MRRSGGGGSVRPILNAVDLRGSEQRRDLGPCPDRRQVEVGLPAQPQPPLEQLPRLPVLRSAGSRAPRAVPAVSQGVHSALQQRRIPTVVFGISDRRSGDEPVGVRDPQDPEDETLSLRQFQIEGAHVGPSVDEDVPLNRGKHT